MVRVTGRRPRPRTLVAVALGIVGIDDGSVRRALLATTRRRYCPGKPMPDLFGPGHATLVCLRVLQAFAIGAFSRRLPDWIADPFILSFETREPNESR